MERPQFDALVAGVISVHGEIIRASSLVDGFPSIDWVPGWQDAMYEKYESWRELAHDHMLHKHMGLLGRIDRHKVAAALMLSILGSPPLAYGEGAEINVLSVYLANEVLAFRVGLHVVTEFLKAEARAKGDTETLFVLRRPFVFPPVAPDADDYRLQTYRALYRLREACHFQSLLLLSNLLFMLEAYHLAYGASGGK